MLTRLDTRATPINGGMPFIGVSLSVFSTFIKANSKLKR